MWEGEYDFTNSKQLVNLSNYDKSMNCMIQQKIKLLEIQVLFAEQSNFQVFIIICNYYLCSENY